MGSELVYAGDEDGETTELVTYVGVANERTDGWVNVIKPVAELAAQIAGTEFVPAAIREKPAAITAAILFGRELDMPPMQSLANIHVIEGRASLAAEQMRAMVFAAGHEITYPELSGVEVTARGRRRYADGSWSAPTTVTWNRAMADAAGLTGKQNWRKYPRAMLEARATGELCRLVFPDVTHGLPSLEELEDGGAVPEAPDGGAVTEGKAKVSRRAKAALPSTPAPAPADVTPVQSSAVGAPPRPPLPSAKVGRGSAAVTPGEGDGSATDNPSTAAGPARVLDFSNEDDRDLAKHLELITYDCPRGASSYHAPHEYQFGAELRDCPGLVAQDCSNKHAHTHHRWATTRGFYWCNGAQGAAVDPELGLPRPDDYPEAELPERPATVADGYEPRHCPDYDSGHDTHTWEDDDGFLWTCSGLANQRLAKAAEKLQAEVEGAAVPDKPQGVSPGQKRAIEAAFKSLGVADRAEIHHAASALLGRKVATFNPIDGDNGGLSLEDGSKLIKALSTVADREALEALIQRAAEEWGATDA